MKTVLLCDADILIYRSAFACEVELAWDDEVSTLHSDLAEAKRVLDDTVVNLQETIGVKRVVMALTGKRNFRKELWGSYKENRRTQRKPLCMRELRKHVNEKYQCLEIPGFEADDVLGIYATRPAPKASAPWRRIIVSIDKDLQQIPGEHFNLVTGEGFSVTAEEADRHFFWQTLVGDNTDNYPGCPGIGPVTANKLLDKHGATWGTVLAAYEKAGLTEADALMQAWLARILRHSDFNEATQEPRLWKPDYH